jgi:hypothetical protein
MFRWIKQTQSNEIKKLLYQNSSASEFFCGYADMKGDLIAKRKLIEMKEQNQRVALLFYKQEKIPSEDLRALLTINAYLREYFDQNDPETSLYKKMMQLCGKQIKTRAHTFDEKFEPILGWKEYYNRDAA